MPLPPLDLIDAIRYCATIASLGIVYNSLEYVFARQEVLTNFFDWRIIRSRYYILIGRPTLGWMFDATLSGTQFVALAVAQTVAALLFPFVVGINLPLAAALAGVVVSVQCAAHVRLLIGLDGSDQMQTVVWAALFLFCLPINDGARVAVAGLIGGQLVLSYFVSGWAKMISKTWRSGAAVALITRTATYSTPLFSRVFTIRPVSFVTAWLTMLFEVAAPFLLLFGRPGAVLFAVIGVAFHAGIAMVMGLTSFVFAFCAGFPVLYYFAGYL